MNENKDGMIITPVLMAGGTGTRLWPLSRKSYPKQFAKLTSNETLFQQTALRFQQHSKVHFTDPISMTCEDYRFIVVDQLQQIGVNPGAVLIEPEVKNTAPAILAAALFEYQKNKDSILLVAPSDHSIRELDKFNRAIEAAYVEAHAGNIVTLGITPTYPETGYGYIEMGTKAADGVFEVNSFVEKPAHEVAVELLSTSNYLWNAGIFVFQAKIMIEAFAKYDPETLALVEKSIENGSVDLGFFRLHSEEWSALSEASIDVTIMERSKSLKTVVLDANWSDLGTWDSVWSNMAQDENGVATSENAHAIECENTLLRSESEMLEIVGVGLKDIVAVATSDAVLIIDKSQSQNVKEAVSFLKRSGVSQADVFPKDHRPWGWYESLALSNRFQVKRICVKPGGSLSLQSHHHRSEHWIVVEGTAKVTVDEKVRLVTEGESIYVPLGSVHRMENPGKLPMLLIEVQTGAYLGEDDIIRYEDIYSRT